MVAEPAGWDVVVHAVSPDARSPVELDAIIRSPAELGDLLGRAVALLPRGGDVIVSVVSDTDSGLRAAEIEAAVASAGLRPVRVVDRGSDSVVVVIAAASPVRPMVSGPLVIAPVDSGYGPDSLAVRSRDDVR